MRFQTRLVSILGWVILGALAGWIAGFITKGGYGFWGDILCGIVGAVLGGWIAGFLLGRDVVNGLSFESLIVAVLGAVIVILVSRMLTRSSAAT